MSNDLSVLLENPGKPKTKRAGMGSHQKTTADKSEWLSPPKLVAALGTFDLDPCAPQARPWDTAITHFHKGEDGLGKKWKGRVWCNPPYGQETGKWLERCAEHKNAIALIFARTETNHWHDFVWPKAHAIFFLRKRIRFYHVSGEKASFNGGAPSALISYNKENTEYIKKSGLEGHLVFL